MCNKTALLYNVDEFPYYSGGTQVKSIHFINFKTGHKPDNAAIIRCPWCGSSTLFQDIGRTWAKVRRNREWDL